MDKNLTTLIAQASVAELREIIQYATDIKEEKEYEEKLQELWDNVVNAIKIFTEYNDHGITVESEKGCYVEICPPWNFSTIGIIKSK